ncbi:nucleotidyltransferase family protein [Aestuariicella hydrocarbonica]|uniref:Nucleotidyltransferase family protein n=1 Tax=Pseudomaricurvus hydrocarbonicus TaxID=1470433 RepID=A0A9E5MPD8_9GAMM|nr:nucleotidyltransferase family protein [Aestuariicella hydrocarbonica]NHO68023.1 nucleotidyltransferase family protein [Aestuariicella hydrocarbonica]
MSSDPATGVCGLILAAGRGRRFGGDKLLATHDDGTSVIQRVIENMRPVVPNCLCVVRSGDQRLQEHLESLKANWISIDSADLGMSQSLIAGVNYFSQAQAWLIGLGDMPYVTADTYQLICQRYVRDQAQQQAQAGQTPCDLPCIVVPEFQCEPDRWRCGNPVLFSHHFLPELQNLTGDVGGKSIIAATPERVQRLPVQDPGILRDIDVPQDLRPTA